MSNLSKFYENVDDNFYLLEGSEPGLITIPKDLSDSIRLFLIFKNSDLQEQEKNKLLVDLQNVSNTVNNTSDNGICVVYFMDSDFLDKENIVTYGKELVRVKRLINTIYNKLLGEGKLKKENFIKQLELVSLDNRYNDFVNWLCTQNPKKFHYFNYQQLVERENSNKQNNVFVNQNAANIFNEPNRQSAMTAMQTNVNPTHETLSIGTPKLPENFNPNGQYFGYNKPKTLVKKLPSNTNNAAFIKWYNTLFILVFSIVIGIIISLFLIK